jgi:hypothetical protein
MTKFDSVVWAAIPDPNHCAKLFLKWKGFAAGWLA